MRSMSNFHFMLIDGKCKMSDEKWSTADGKSCLYSELQDGHLKNIIKDGYRNPWIIEEAEARGFEVPVRPVDKLTYADLIIYEESFASCAISGKNKFAMMMIEAKRTNPAKYQLFLNRMLIQKEKDGK